MLAESILILTLHTSRLIFIHQTSLHLTYRPARHPTSHLYLLFSHQTHFFHRPMSPFPSSITRTLIHQALISQSSIPTSQSSDALFPGSCPKSAAAIMVRAFKVHELDGLEILTWEDAEIRESNEGEICVKNQAIEVSFIDICPDKGVCRATTIPFTPSIKAVRMVIAVGSQR